MWLIEGTASMYATLLGWQLDNGVSFRNLRNFGQSEVVLANRSTYDGARPGYRRGAGVLTALDYRIRAATDGEQSFQDVLTTMSDRDDEINATELQSIAESVADREFETFFDRYVYGDEPYPLPPKPAHYPAIETEPITATVTGPEVTPSDCIVVLDRSISIGNQDTQGLPSDLTTLRGPYASVPVGTSPAVSVPAEPFSRAGVSEPYDLYYLQDSEERAFPRDGVADAVSLGSVDTLPGSVETTLADVPTRTLTARAVNESGEPIPNAGIAVHVEDQVAIRSQTTAEGAFLNRSGTRGVELGDGVKISARSPATQSLPRFALPDGRALDTRIILQETVPDLAVVGTAVPRSLSVDEAATLSLLVANLGDAEDRTETVYVDGDPVTEVSLEDREAFSWTTPVTLTFETPGTHTIRVGENPPRSVDVDPASLAADFEVSPGSPEAGGIVTFENATASTAPVESLEWDLDDDGTVEKTGETVTYSYDDAGTYNVTLTVTNADGESDAVTRTVTVTERTGPPALPGETALPQDPDDDGVYEDVTGDGALTIADVRLYFESIYQNRDSAYVENNRGFFDLTSDGAISLGDMQALFEAVSRGISPSGTTNLESLSSRTGVSGS
jgi:PKD repeat protein